MTLLELKTEMVKLSREAKEADQKADALQREAVAVEKRVKRLKERSDRVQRKLASA